MTDVGTLGGRQSAAMAINARGQVVGWADRGLAEAFLWENGVMRGLGSLGGESEALAINNAVQIVGESGGRATFWENGVMRDLGSLEGYPASGAWDINQAGVVVGFALRQNGPDRVYRAFLHDGRQMIDLGTLGGEQGSARAINDHGAVVGGAETETGVVHAFLWKDGLMHDLTPDYPSTTYACDINNTSSVVGRPAFLWSDGDMIKLNDKLPPESPWHLSVAFGINEKGQIVGWGEIRSRDHAFLMTPYKCGEAIRQMKLHCTPVGKLKAKVRTTLPEGAMLVFLLDNAVREAVLINERGRAKARWRRQTGEHEICIVECPEFCRALECP